MNNDKQLISIHPRLVSGFDLSFGLFFWWWLGHVTAWWMLILWLVSRIAAWAVLARLSYFSDKISRLNHFVSLAVFGLGALSLLLFVDWGLAYTLVSAAFVLLPALSFWFLPSRQVDLSFEFKTVRRWQFLLAAFGLFGVASGLSAVASFQLFYSVSNLVWWAVASVVFAAGAFWWWRQYGVERGARIWLWTGVTLLLMLELIGAVMIWPVGFLTAGVVIVWSWYVIWLLVRFHLSAEGIVWKKQKFFLAFNFLVMAIFLAVLVRWR